MVPQFTGQLRATGSCESLSHRIQVVDEAATIARQLPPAGRASVIAADDRHLGAKHSAPPCEAATGRALAEAQHRARQYGRALIVPVIGGAPWDGRDAALTFIKMPRIPRTGAALDLLRILLRARIHGDTSRCIRADVGLTASRAQGGGIGVRRLFGQRGVGYDIQGCKAASRDLGIDGMSIAPVGAKPWHGTAVVPRLFVTGFHISSAFDRTDEARNGASGHRVGVESCPGGRDENIRGLRDRATQRGADRDRQGAAAGIRGLLNSPRPGPGPQQSQARPRRPRIEMEYPATSSPTSSSRPTSELSAASSPYVSPLLRQLTSPVIIARILLSASPSPPHTSHSHHTSTT